MPVEITNQSLQRFGTVWLQATVPTAGKWIANEQYISAVRSHFVDRNQLCTNAPDVEKRRVFLASTWAAGCASQARPFSLGYARLLTCGDDNKSKVAMQLNIIQPAIRATVRRVPATFWSFEDAAGYVQHEILPLLPGESWRGGEFSLPGGSHDTAG